MKTNFPLDYFVRGRRVRYVPGHAVGPYDMNSCEDGTVLRAHNDTVFVKFDPKVQRLGWNGATPEACSSTDLWSDPDWHVVHDPVMFFSIQRCQAEAIKSLLKP